jgi:hypothetical protein
MEENSSKSEELMLKQDFEAIVAQGLGKWETVDTTTIFDGAQLFEYSKNSGASVVEPDKAAPHHTFDPRQLGLSSWFRPEFGFGRSLPIDRIETASLARNGTDLLVEAKMSWGENRKWRVSIDGSFQVAQFEAENKFEKSVVLSNYENTQPFQALPTYTKVTTSDIESGRQLTVTEVKQTAIAEVSPKEEVFSIAGLQLPVGEMMIDERLHEVTGFWDGKELSSSPVSKSGPPPEPRSWRWIWLAVLPVVFFGTLVFRQLRRRHSLGDDRGLAS